MIEYYQPDLVIYHYKPKIHLTWEMVKHVAELTNSMIEFKPCFMCSVIGSGLTIEKEVRENGTRPEMQQYTLASAIVQNSLAHKILANFIIKIQRPIAPTKSFTKLQDALDWFESFRNKRT